MRPEPAMSRSRRKTPIFGFTTATSEAFDKAKWHRAFRRAENQRLTCDPETEAHHFREFYNPWSMHKDGKHWWSEALRRPGGMRK
jgi:hypothetical protein